MDPRRSSHHRAGRQDYKRGVQHAKVAARADHASKRSRNQREQRALLRMAFEEYVAAAPLLIDSLKSGSDGTMASGQPDKVRTATAMLIERALAIKQELAQSSTTTRSPPAVTAAPHRAQGGKAAAAGALVPWRPPTVGIRGGAPPPACRSQSGRTPPPLPPRPSRRPPVPATPWHAIVGLSRAKTALTDALTLPARFPATFAARRLRPTSAVLLYGPPGTGKTALAAAAAAAAGLPLLTVSAADVMSKWVGDAEKAMRAVFQAAAAASPSVLFLDEVDALATDRQGGGGGGGDGGGGGGGRGSSDAARRVTTELLVQLQAAADAVAIHGPQCRVLVIGATNVPWALDAALRRRFEVRLHVPLPGRTARAALLRSLLGATTTAGGLSAADLDAATAATSGWSCADIGVAARGAALAPLREVATAPAVRVAGESLGGRTRRRGGCHLHHGAPAARRYVPCAADDPRAVVDVSPASVPEAQLLVRGVTAADVAAAVRAGSASVGRAEVERYHRWTREFGMDGS